MFEMAGHVRFAMDASFPTEINNVNDDANHTRRDYAWTGRQRTERGSACDVCRLIKKRKNHLDKTICSYTS